MIASTLFLLWLVAFVIVAARLRGLRRSADALKLLRVFAGFLGLSAVVALVVAPPDFGGWVLLALGLSFGGSAGGFWARHTLSRSTAKAFAVARAAGAGGCLWIIAAILAASDPRLAEIAADSAGFITLLLAALVSALSFGGLAATALPNAVHTRLQSLLRGMSWARYVALGLVLFVAAFAVGLGSIPLLWVSTAFAALGGGLYTLHCKDAARLSHNARLDAGAAFAMGMIGIALADPMTIAVGGFAGAALMAIARRAAKRSV